MRRFDPTEFGRLLARLTPQELRKVEGLVSEARERAEAVLEIDGRAEAGGPAAFCSRCGGESRIRWGRTRTGVQRWRCSGCHATWSGRSGTPILAATDRAGHRVFEAIADAGQVAISGALLPVLARDAVLCTDGHASYERIAKDELIPHFALNAGRRSKRTPRSHHINTVNALIGRFRAFMQPFCGPASRNLAAYGRWHAARDNADRSYLDALRPLLASAPRTNTVC